MPHAQQPARRAQAPTAPPADDVTSPPEGALHACPSCRCGQPEPRSWRIEFRPGTPLLTSNHRSSHWGPRHEITTSIKDVAMTLARAQKIPLGLDRVSFTALFLPPEGQRRVVRETHNLAPVAKAAIDGVTKAGVIRDDSDRYVDSVTFRPGPTHPLGQFVLIITEEPTTP